VKRPDPRDPPDLLESTLSVGDGAPSAGAPPIDGHIGRYVVRGALGAGGMGIVVAAYDPELDRKVAIKLVTAGGEQARTRLVREAQAMARLSHPNVVTVHEVVWIGERAGIVMELVEGQDLAAWRDAGGHGWREAVALYVQAARGLAAAHRAGLVHRDFKPSNALVGKDGIVRVTDFGLARTLAADELEPALAGGATRAQSGDAPSALEVTITRTGTLVGTPAYMAPEQHLSGPVDARTDQWALACSLYEALYGQRPFDGDERESLRDRVVRGELRADPTDVRVPRAVRSAVRRALSPNPADRFADMDELVAVLTAPVRRAWRLSAAAAALLVLAFVVGGVLLARRDGAGAACRGLDAPMRAEWNAAKAATLRQRLLAGGRAAAVADRVIAALDDFSSRWAAARTQACTETQKGVRSQEALDRRMRCLDQRFVEVSAVVDGLVGADKAGVDGAADAVDRLHPVSDCDDPRESVPRPAGADARRAIDDAEKELARAWAFSELNQYEKALAAARDAAAVGKRTGWAPLEARALVIVGDCQQRQHNYSESAATFERAASLAAEAKDDTTLAEALAARFFVLDEHLGRPAEALAGRQFVELALVRAGQPPTLRARWLHYLGIALHEQHQEDQALAVESEAVAMWRKLVRPDSARLIDSLETEANIQISRQQFDVAAKLLGEVLAARIAARGPDDALVADAEDNLGVLEFSRYDMPAAIAHWKRAARISAASGKPNWRIYSNLGAAQSELGHVRAALADFEKARDTVEREAPGESLYAAEAVTSIGATLTALGQLDRARPLLERGVAVARQAKAPFLAIALSLAARLALLRGDVAAASADLAELEHVDDDAKDPMLALVTAAVAKAKSGCRAARGAIDRALAAVATDPFRSERLDAAVMSAQCHVAGGEARRAIGELEPELTWLEAQHPDVEAAASARLTLAQALEAGGGDRARAKALAEAALPGLFGKERAAATALLARLTP